MQYIFASQDLEIDPAPGIAHPLSSSLLVDSGGKEVQMFCDGKYVESPLDSAINYLAQSPLAIKKKPLLEVSDE